jgi:hypothetical protein
MKLVTFDTREREVRVGVLSAGEGSVIDLSTSFGSMLDLIDAGERGLERARELEVPAKGIGTLTNRLVRA